MLTKSEPALSPANVSIDVAPEAPAPVAAQPVLIVTEAAPVLNIQSPPRASFTETPAPSEKRPSQPALTPSQSTKRDTLTEASLDQSVKRASTSQAPAEPAQSPDKEPRLSKADAEIVMSKAHLELAAAVKRQSEYEEKVRKLQMEIENLGYVQKQVKLV